MAKKLRKCTCYVGKDVILFNPLKGKRILKARHKKKN
jgi:hypothetical protein